MADRDDVMLNGGPPCAPVASTRELSTSDEIRIAELQRLKRELRAWFICQGVEATAEEIHGLINRRLAELSDRPAVQEPK